MNEKQALIHKDVYSFDDLQEIVRILRSPDGCLWDRVQTHQSIRMNFLEEVYETVETLDRDDLSGMKEELGDVLFQVVFHGTIEEERGRFDLSDVVDGICRKMILRHPHVFGVNTTDENGNVLKDWEAIKANSHDFKTTEEVLRAIPKTLPALMRADKIGSKSRKAGFDHPDVSEALEKVDEELSEVKEAIRNHESMDRLEEEFGDLFLSASCAARLAGVDSELSLTRACEKFLGRISCVERLCHENGTTIATTNREKLLEYWKMAKK